MKNLTLTFIASIIAILSYGQTSKTVNSTAGNLITLLTATELSEVTNLTITGTIDARDFKTMRDEMPLLAEIDLSGVEIVEYTGNEGTSLWGNTYYQENAIPEYAFSNGNLEGKISLSNVILPLSATSIMEGAFNSCYGLVEVSFPPSLTYIGYASFHRCEGLTSINLPEGLTTIGDAAFHRCRNLTSIYIPSTVSYIGGLSLGYSSFIIVDGSNIYYSSIDGVLFNKNQTSLLQYYNSNVDSYNIPASVKSIGQYAFYLCEGLKSVFIPSSVTSIEFESFAYCSGLTSVSIPSSVNFINTQAFNSCYNLNSIYSYSSTPIDLSASTDVFNNVNKTACILYVPFGSRVSYQAANQWQDFTSIVEMDGFRLSRTTASLGFTEGSTATVNITSNVEWSAISDQSWILVSPASGIGEHTVTFTAETNPSIGTRDAVVTVSASGIESQTIQVIQDGAPLTVTPGDLISLLTTEELATITKLTLTGTIDARDFKTMRDEMPLLDEIDLSGIEISEYTGTEGTIGTGNINYPANAIPGQAFYNKAGLTFLLLPESVTDIGDYSFWGCEGFTSFVVPPLVTNIGYAAFNSCYNLTDIVIPASVISIGSQVFSFCNALYSINIPSSVTDLGSRAFSYCPALINVDDNNPMYSSSEGVLFNKDQTLLINYPVSRAGEYHIPSTVVRIEESAFVGYGDLTSLTIPASVESIGNQAFWGQSGLSSIYVYSQSPIDLSSSYYVFQYVDKTTCTISVPYGSGAAYRSANQWQDFENIVERSGFNLSTTSAYLGYQEGSTSSVDISSDIAWTVTSDQSWLIVFPISGINNGTITFTALLNSATVPRIANVTVSSEGLSEETIVITQGFNNPPVADAGPDQSVGKGAPVTLDGSASFDLDDDPITYLWTAPAGIKLSSTNVAQPTFYAPKGNISGPLSFTLIVNDGMLDSQSDEVVINVVDINNPPVVVCNDLTIVLNADGYYSFTEQDLANLAIGTTDDNDSFNKLLIEAIPNSFSCGDVGISTQVNVTVTDMSGASSSCEAVIIVIDETGPVFGKGSKSDRKTINTGETYLLPDYSLLFPATDNCGSVSYSQNPAPGEIYSVSTKEKVSLIASDSYGNSTETVISFTLVVKTLKSAKIEASNVDPNQPNLNVYPNPFKDRIFFELELPENSDVLLELFNANGSKLKTIFSGSLQASERVEFEYLPDNLTTQMIFYKLIINDVVFSGKLVLTE